METTTTTTTREDAIATLGAIREDLTTVMGTWQLCAFIDHGNMCKWYGFDTSELELILPLRGGVRPPGV